MIFFNPKRYSGFTLIEVLIALVIAVVGILAMIQLSGSFLKTVSESEQRTIAYAIAEQTIENLRSFDSLAGSTAGETYFDNIVSSTATATVPSGLGSYTFNIAWTISNNIVASGAVSPGASGAINRILKQVDVQVSWAQPDAGSIALSSYIGGIDPNAGALNDISNVGGSEAKVQYNPGVAPDVIAIDVGDSKLKETTKPLPEVSKNNQSTQTRFETITYKSGYELVQEDFLTVNCQCLMSLNGNNTITAPAYQKYVDGEIVEVTGDLVSGATGTVKALSGSNTQSSYCSRCCANHHDTAGSTVKFSPLAGTASLAGLGVNNHPHYKIKVSDPTDLEEAGYGEEYLEACRFKRIDGIYRLVQDWNLKQINVVPNDSLVASTAIDAYVRYVIESLRYYVFDESLGVASLALPTLASAAETSLTLGVGGVDDSISRSIYLDDINAVDGLAAHLSSISAASIADTSYLDWLQFIPFYEVNTTLLSLWDEANPNIAEVENQVVSETYLRGRITGIASGATIVTASMAQGNTGILGNVYNDENVYAGQQNPIVPIDSGREWITEGPYDAMPVTVSASSAGGTTYSISITGQVSITGGAALSSLNCTGDQVAAITASTATATSVSYTCTVSDIPTGDDFTGSVTISTTGARCTPANGTLSYKNITSNQTAQDFSIANNKPSCP